MAPSETHHTLPPSTLTPHFLAAVSSEMPTPHGHILAVESPDFNGSTIAKILAGVAIIVLGGVLLVIMRFGRRMPRTSFLTPALQQEAESEKPKLWEVHLEIVDAYEEDWRGRWKDMMPIATEVIPSGTEIQEDPPYLIRPSRCTRTDNQTQSRSVRWRYPGRSRKIPETLQVAVAITMPKKSDWGDAAKDTYLGVAQPRM
ncbi:hypothetical protein BXZ70DRAFT_543301 [Cristinia sonorae]|uniref:Uncharacterized protein n=1 Tax=Cristinia sonorae TaxID=1940300 RepID=A0A8K0UIA9_9AGAR|nr:hypothetical protein BXZ70DRAFT_543301 [Cristinia sonorae]